MGMDGDTIKLNADGLYEIDYDVAYDNDGYKCAYAQLEINGEAMKNTLRNLHPELKGVNCTYMHDGAAGDTVRIKISGANNIKGMVMTLVLKRYKFKGAED